MELKLTLFERKTLSRMLLIVPYGIETKSQYVGITDADIPFNRTLWN